VPLSPHPLPPLKIIPPQQTLPTSFNTQQSTLSPWQRQRDYRQSCSANRALFVSLPPFHPPPPLHLPNNLLLDLGIIRDGIKHVFLERKYNFPAAPATVVLVVCSLPDACVFVSVHAYTYAYIRFINIFIYLYTYVYIHSYVHTYYTYTRTHTEYTFSTVSTSHVTEDRLFLIFLLSHASLQKEKHVTEERSKKETGSWRVQSSLRADIFLIFCVLQFCSRVVIVCALPGDASIDHVTHMNESWRAHTWVASRVNLSYRGRFRSRYPSLPCLLVCCRCVAVCCTCVVVCCTCVVVYCRCVVGVTLLSYRRRFLCPCPSLPCFSIWAARVVRYTELYARAFVFKLGMGRERELKKRRGMKKRKRQRQKEQKRERRKEHKGEGVGDEESGEWTMSTYVWRDSIHMCDITHSYVWHDSFVCVT